LQDFIFSKEQLLKELDMYQEIAVAKGLEYDNLNQTMDNIQENIETLSDEIQRLQGKNCLIEDT
jgi:predicted  nucleic acid-binding Zn-ribbon protein